MEQVSTLVPSSFPVVGGRWVVETNHHPPPGSEGQPEPELYRPRRVREVRARVRLAVSRAALLQRVRLVVGAVEHVEHFRDQICGSTATEPERLLEPDVGAVHRLTDEVVARHDRPIRTEPRAAGRTDGAHVAAVAGELALAGAVEVDPADLEAAGDLPDAVEDGAMPLVGRGKTVLAPEVSGHRERHLLDAAQRSRIAIAQRR